MDRSTHAVTEKVVGVSLEGGIQAACSQGSGHMGRNHRAFLLEAEQRTCVYFRECRLETASREMGCVRGKNQLTEVSS